MVVTLNFQCYPNNSASFDRIEHCLRLKIKKIYAQNDNVVIQNNLIHWMSRVRGRMLSHELLPLTQANLWNTHHQQESPIWMGRKINGRIRKHCVCIVKMRQNNKSATNQSTAPGAGSNESEERTKKTALENKNNSLCAKIRIVHSKFGGKV